MLEFIVKDLTDGTIEFCGNDENRARRLYDFLVLKMGHTAALGTVSHDSSVPEFKD